MCVFVCVCVCAAAAGSGPDRLFSGRWERMRCHVTCEKDAETEQGHSVFFLVWNNGNTVNKKKSSEGHLT